MTPLWAIGTVALCTLLLAAGQVLFKVGIDRLPDMVATAVPIGAGLLLLFVAGLGITWALREGELSVLYPVISLGFVWVILSGRLWFGEALSAPQLAGAAAVMLGVAVIGHSSRGRR